MKHTMKRAETKPKPRIVWQFCRKHHTSWMRGFPGGCAECLYEQRKKKGLV